MSLDPPECTKCGSDYTLELEHEPYEHGMCWPCASAALEEALPRIAQLELQVTELQEANTREVERRRQLQAEARQPSIAGFTHEDRHGRALIDAALELRSAILAYGRRPLASLHEGYGVLAEEVAELFDEVRKRKPDRAAAREEASQVAAVALRIMAELTEGEHG